MYLFRKTSSRTKSLITVLDYGYLRRRAETTDTQNHGGQHHYTVVRHTMSQEASHLPLINAEYIPLDTSLVEIRLNRLSIQ